jgi:CDP-glucose 4,6-dehydratase
VNPDFWRGKRVYLTGHTGFKGSWLSIWLQSMGAELKGLALAPPTEPNLFELAGTHQGMTSELGDVRHHESVLKSMQDFQPELVIHMAAQPLVRYSYQNPIETYATNVMGTVHVLDSARQTPSVRAVVNVTTDKCYENKEWPWGYREDEPMGGYDPYSSSKGCSELVTSAFRNSFFDSKNIGLASARSGNVIGGGDWAADRLVPDILKAFEAGEHAQIRNPLATRPWQHVLEPLSGYLTLAERLWHSPQKHAQAWNFGPRDSDARSVEWIANELARQWGGEAHWDAEPGDHLHEAHYLKLDISKARQLLGWHPRWDLKKALSMTVEWHRAWLDGADMHSFCLKQIQEYNATPS